MRNHVLRALVGLILVTPFLFTQTKASPETKTVTTAPAPIPEDARKHFVVGTTLFKEAKTADDFAQVVSEFKQAADLVPQWPDARYNLALAKEAAEDYSGAMVDLKLYQQFKLSDTEARTVQDKLYALEAKAGLATRKQATREAAATDAVEREADERAGFSDNRDGTVREHRTGLIWQKDDDGKKRNWYDSISYCRSLSLAGHSDWRLPNRDELTAYRDITMTLQIRKKYFSSMKYGTTELADIYWASTSPEPGSSYADFASFGTTGMIIGIDKTGTVYARCVRGGQ